METKLRSLTKAVLWTLLGLFTMTLVGLLSTGSLALGSKMALANAGLGLVSYVIYERIWARVGWGRVYER